MDRNKELRADVFEIIHALMSLALLHHSQIKDGFTFVQKLTEKIIKEDEKNVYGILISKIKKLLSYFNNYWMVKVTPRKFSVFGILNKTDNFSESYHKQLNSVMPKNPTPKKFLGKYKYYI